MAGENKTDSGLFELDEHLARAVLTSFLLTFIAARILVFLIMSRRIPDLYLRLGGTHIHHLNHGIFLLAVVGAYLLFSRPEGRRRTVAALIYGVGLALTFDEFGMWVRLGGGYWQRASLDAIGVLVAVFGLIAYAPEVRKFRAHHWLNAIVTTIAVVVFFVMLAGSFSYAGRKIEPKLQQIESTSPP